MRALKLFTLVNEKCTLFVYSLLFDIIQSYNLIIRFTLVILFVFYNKLLASYVYTKCCAILIAFQITTKLLEAKFGSTWVILIRLCKARRKLYYSLFIFIFIWLSLSWNLKYAITDLDNNWTVAAFAVHVLIWCTPRV